MPNRLAQATSPYLLQHAENPVDWWEWGPAAFAEARRRDVPVLLSVGYAACHWCHVMAHESFEDPAVAGVLNRGFVPVKVDREERPDIDAVYLTATTAMTGRGGWPMTCLLTPSGEPFYCGTYYPKAQFLQLLAAVTQAWEGDRQQVLASGSHVAETLRSAPHRGPSAPLGPAELAAAVERLQAAYDPVHAGFGAAPKFPPSMVLELLLRHHGRTGSEAALAMAQQTCAAMARGGIYDQLAGGFARYAVDAAWVVPHFEKMLYDNAQLLRVYAHLWRSTGDPLAERVARETAEHLRRDLGVDGGGFASSLDADTDGVEGSTYVWDPAQLAEVLGQQDGRRAAALLSVTQGGTFEHGRSTLQLRADPDDPGWWAGVKATLYAARAARPQPARDDKVVTSWNGLAVAALADAGAVLGEPALVRAAADCASFLLAEHVVDGRLRRSSRDGRVGAALAVADDYGNLAEGLLALHQASFEVAWLAAAGELLDAALDLFADGEDGFYDTGRDAEALFTRPRSQADNAEPSGHAALAGALLQYAALTGSQRHRSAAEAAVSAAAGLAVHEPRFAGWTLATAEVLAAGPVQVAVVGRGAAAAELVAVARRSGSPGLVLAHGEPDSPGQPLLSGRPLVGGEPAAYVCRGFVCDRPVTSAADLRAALTRAC